MMRFLIGFFAIGLSCGSLVSQTLVPKSDALHLDWLDTHIKPRDNFYAYANAGWQKSHPIPPQYATWGTFSLLHEAIQKKIQQMVIDASKNRTAQPGSIEQKVGDFYFSGMDEPSIEQLGTTPLQDDFQRIEAVNDEQGLQAVITYLQQMGVDVCFGFGSMPDFMNSKERIGTAVQGGLSLPNRDYYLKKDVKFKKIRVAYLQYITKMFQLLGESLVDATAAANVVMRIETDLAKASLSQIEQRDPHAIYHIKEVAQFNAITPHFSWDRYLLAIGHPDIKHMNMGMPGFFKAFNQLLETVSLHDWKIYLRWHLLDSFAPFLSTPFVHQQFMMSSAITGTKELLPRWKRVIATENGALGFAMGRLYVEQYFPSTSKQKVLQMVQNIHQVLRTDLQTLRWMTPTTRAAAIRKIDRMEERVGYPEQWWDYTDLTIDRGPYVLNVKRANQFLNKRDLDKIGKPIDEKEWAMTPQTVNAYYDPSMNQINIPAGILQPPFFDPNAPAAVNYGAIGFVIGHEMTHGFDDEGSQFDANGNLKNWWTQDDLKKFKTSTQCIAKQFSNYKVGSMAVQGPLVVGEATADLGGVVLAYRAFHASSDYKTAKKIHGFTPDQQFFLGVAHVWAANTRLEQARHLITVDPHPPMMYRVNGTLANMMEFQRAFGITGPSSMVHEHRCLIW
jgi:putative endopeptidase